MTKSDLRKKDLTWIKLYYMLPNLYSKLPKIGESIFATMTKMANDYKAINLSQGFPDFNCSEELIERVSFYQANGFNQYAPMTGVPKLREKISEKINKIYGKYYNPEKEIVVTAGATQAIYTAITSVIVPGDEVIIIEPAYDSYVPAVLLSGGIPIFIPLSIKDYKVQWEIVERAISEKTKLIIINSPHNPTGSIFKEEDIQILERVIKNRNIFIISDEVYEHIIFDGKVHQSFSASPILSEKTFVINSFGKTYHTTGWKVGYCAAPEKLMIEFRKVHQFIVFAVNTPMQHAFADIMDNEGMYLSLGRFYQAKRDLIISLLSKSKFKINPTFGTYFQLLDYTSISELNDLNFCEYLTKEIGVAAIPLSPFYNEERNDRVIRICFAKKDEILHEAANRLCKI